MESESFEFVQCPLNEPLFRERAETFLAECGGLRLEDCEYFETVLQDGKIAACGGYDGGVIKCLAVAEPLRGAGLMNTLVSRLMSGLRALGCDNVFVFTSPSNRRIFEGMGFCEVAATEGAALFENRKDGLIKWFSPLKRTFSGSGETGAVVLNANPFTNGHLSLLKRAAAECGVLYAFVVREELSAFPYEVRLDLVRRGAAGIDNLMILDGGQYIISRATFPSYFLKQAGRAAVVHSRLDAEVFARIARVLDIKRRFVGDEPFDLMTSQYNAALLEVLPHSGIGVEVLPRLLYNGKPVSATDVRKAAASGDLSTVKSLVPTPTYEYLSSAEAAGILAGLL